MDRVEVIQIEICRGFKPKCYDIRVGDVMGATEICNTTLTDMMEEIKSKVKELPPYDR